MWNLRNWVYARFFSFKCIRRDRVECNLKYFIFYSISLSLLYTVVFTFVPCAITALKTCIASRNGADAEEDGLVIKNRIREISDELQQEESIPLSAFVTVVFLFFQIASLVHVRFERNQYDGDETKSITEILNPVFDLFNFRFTVYSKLCPMKDMTLPIKESLNILLKFSSIFNLVIIYIFWKCVVYIKKCCSSCQRDR